MMRELTVRVSDNQFDILVNFLRTLPYVQLPSSWEKKENKEQESLFDKPVLAKMPFDIASLGEMDNTPFDIEDIKKNSTIKWDNFHEVIALFKDVPLENHIEQHTELYTD